jgi:hypothetical protein
VNVQIRRPRKSKTNPKMRRIDRLQGLSTREDVA